MSEQQWHVAEPVWEAYVSGRLDAVAEASVDAHVMSCQTCQASATSFAEPRAIASAWARLEAAISRPELPRALRWLRRFGVAEEDLVVLAAADGFLLPWSLAVGMALACTAVAAFNPAHSSVTFFLMAPLIPVLAVVAAFDATDPIRSLTTAAPYSKLRLALLRTAATLVVAMPSAMTIGVSLPGLHALAFVWLLPALVLVTAALVLLTWFGPWTSSGTVAVTWSVIVLALPGLDLDALTGAVAQASYAGLVIALGTALVVRTTSFRLLGGEG